MTIKAVTFDLWDTLVADDSDEPKRKARGLRSKREERRYQVWRALDDADAIDPAIVSLAYDVAEAGFNMVWKEQHINWTVAQRLRVILNGLGRSLPDSVFQRLVADHGRMEVAIPPDPIDGVEAALERLSGRYKLAVVSDAIVTPGTGLRAMLKGHDLAGYFSAFAFSDEVGHSKPHRSMFDSAAGQLGVGLDEIVHIGDRDHNDVRGPHALGVKAILFIATRDVDKEGTMADAVCAGYRELPAIIDRLSAEN